MKDRIFEFIKNKKKKIVIYSVLLIIINLILNYNCILSLFNKTEPIIYKNQDFVINENVYEIIDIDKEINMLQINFTKIPSTMSINYTSDSFSKYDHVNPAYNIDNIPGYNLISYVSVAGDLNDMKFFVKDGLIDSIILNPKIPYKLNFFGTFIIFFILLLIKYLFKTNNKLNLKDYQQLLITFGVVSTFISICFVFCMAFMNAGYKFGDIYEYHYVDAVMNGQLHFNYEVSDFLNEVSYPFDTSNRDYDFLWDASLYKGKYYCYFGIWPVISLFIPFNFITGNYLSTPIACLFYAILGIISTVLLYNAIIKKYFNKISFQTYILSLIFVLMGSKLMWCMYRPCFYEIVSLASYFHVVLGLYLVLFFDKRSINFIGYWLLALAVLCRPTSLFYSVLIIPKLWKKLKDKNIKILDLVLLMVPYLIVGIFTMYINYIRFDSIFEFGISYQLTTNDLYNHKFSLMSSIFGVFNYLFGLIKVDLFPFRLTNLFPTLPLIADFHIENIGGGVITTSIIGFVILFIPKIFKYIKDNYLKIYIILSLVVAFIIMILSSGLGALIGRYMLDFNFVFYLVIVILSLYILKIYNNNSKIKNIYFTLILFSIIINFLITTTNK